MTSVIDLPEIAGVGGQTPTLQPAFAEATARQALNMYPIAGRLSVAIWERRRLTETPYDFQKFD